MILPALQEKPTGTLIVASAQQRQALKRWILDERKGLWGWNILTKYEAQRRHADIGPKEMQILAKLELAEIYWPKIPAWADIVFDWLEAGYNIEEIPFRSPHWMVVTKKILGQLGAAKKKISASVGLEADIIAGINPLSLWKHNSSALGLIIEGEVCGSALTKLEFLEATLGEASWCDDFAQKEPIRLKVSNLIDFKNAINSQLAVNNNVKRIVSTGGPSMAVLDTLDALAPGRMNQPMTDSWLERASLQNFFDSNLKGLSTKGLIEKISLQVLAREKSPSEVQSFIDTTLAKWQDSGRLEVSLLPGQDLPDYATPKIYAKLCPAVWEERAKKAVKNFSSLERFLPAGNIPKRLWLEELTSAKYEVNGCGGIELVDFYQAEGLMDDETILAWTGLPVSNDGGLLDEEKVNRLNQNYYTEGKTPDRGYIEASGHPSLLARQSQAVKTCQWVILENTGIENGLTAKKCSYRVPEQNNASTVCGKLIKKHVIRQNPNEPFGLYDYAIEKPWKASCKQWESIITGPELAWYQVLKLRPTWSPLQGAPVSLWVGNWVHEAMKSCMTSQEVEEFFLMMIQKPETSLVWRQTVSQAWKIADGFVGALAAANVVVKHKELAMRGSLLVRGNEKLLLNGRVDQIVTLPDGQDLIIDFKTSSATSPLSLSKVEDGDGLQLWLYGRLYGGLPALCRLGAGDKLKPQVIVTKDAIRAEKLIGHVFQTGVMGQLGQVWGRFGGEGRLPLAALPQNSQIMVQRRKATYGILA